MQLNYSNSGVKTLRVSSGFFLGVSILASLILIPSWWTNEIYFTTLHWNMIALSLIIFVVGFVLFGLCYAIATIAENAFLNKQLKEKELLLDEDKENKNTHISD